MKRDPDSAAHARASGWLIASAPNRISYGPRTRREFMNLLRWNGGSRA